MNAMTLFKAFLSKLLLLLYHLSAFLLAPAHWLAGIRFSSCCLIICCISPPWFSSANLFALQMHIKWSKFYAAFCNSFWRWKVQMTDDYTQSHFPSLYPDNLLLNLILIDIFLCVQRKRCPWNISFFNKIPTETRVALNVNQYVIFRDQYGGEDLRYRSRLLTLQLVQVLCAICFANEQLFLPWMVDINRAAVDVNCVST